MQKINKAFTLVELIVVIVILAILGTISFIVMQGYTKNARDSVRKTDLRAIISTLEIFQAKSGFFPIPTDSVEVTYIGGLVWTQGTFGETTRTNVGNMSKIPTDPLTESQYTYSVLNGGQRYELGGALEGEVAYNNNLLLNHTYASVDSLSAYIIGNYNGKVLKTNTGGVDYILAIPSIIASDLSDTEIQTIIDNKKLSYKGYENLPHSYGNLVTSSGGFEYMPRKILVWSGSINDLRTGSGFTKFSAGLYAAYLGTNLYLKGDDFKYINGKDVQEFIFGIKPNGTLHSNCKEIKEKTKATQDGCYNLFGELLDTDVSCLDTEDVDKFYCDMNTDGGGRTMYVKIKGNYAFNDAKNCVYGTKINNSLLYCFVPFSLGKNKELFYKDLTTGSEYINSVDEPFDEYYSSRGTFYRSTYFDLMYHTNTPTVVKYIRLGHNFMHIHSVCGPSRSPGGVVPWGVYMNYSNRNIDTGNNCGPLPGNRQSSPRAGEFYVR